MKLSISRSELTKALSHIQAIVEKRNSMPILANVLLDTGYDEAGVGVLHVSATDLEVTIQGWHRAEVSVPGRITASAKKLYEIVRELPDEKIYLEATSNSYLLIRCARARFTLAGASAGEYPTLPSFTPEQAVPIQGVVLSTMLERTMYAASLDETRYNLNGVFLEVLEETGKIRMVATDGHRLALVDRGLGDDARELASRVIIPRKGLAELKRLLDEEDGDEVQLAFEGNSGLARKGPVTVVMRLIEGEFPSYGQVIPPGAPRQVTLPVEDLAHALRRVALLASQQSRAVTLVFSAGHLDISSRNPDLGDAHEQLDIDYNGESISIGFNARYLLDALVASHAKEVYFGFQDDLTPVRIVPTDDQETLAVVMPMRL